MTKLGNRSLFGLIHDYLKVYLPVQRKLSPNTIRSYREALELLVDFVKEQKGVPLQDVTFEMMTGDMITAYLDYLECKRGCGVSTRSNRLAAVRTFFEYAADRDVTAAFVLSDMKKIPVKKPDRVNVIGYMSIAAITAIVEQTDVTIPKSFRDRVFIILMYDTGARIQEMIDIKLCDLRFGKTSTIVLHGKGNKDPKPSERTCRCGHASCGCFLFAGYRPACVSVAHYSMCIHGHFHSAHESLTAVWYNWTCQ